VSRDGGVTARWMIFRRVAPQGKIAFLLGSGSEKPR
jgi:hypothetical protein